MFDNDTNYDQPGAGRPGDFFHGGEWIIGAVDAQRHTVGYGELPPVSGPLSAKEKQERDAAEGKMFFDFLDACVGAMGVSALDGLKKVSQARWKGSNPKLKSIVGNLSKVANNVLTTAGRNEADRLDRPNIFCCIYGTSMAPGASLAFSITPGNGNSYYRVLGFLADDLMAATFGFSSLKIGGQEHVQFSQTTPAAPVTAASSWNVFQLRESRLRTNIAPWSGQFFDGTVPITGTIVNMTVAATGNAITLAPILTVLAQSDPCAYNTAKVKEGASRFWNSMGKGIGGILGVGLSSK